MRFRPEGKKGPDGPCLRVTMCLCFPGQRSASDQKNKTKKGGITVERQDNPLIDAFWPNLIQRCLETDKRPFMQRNWIDNDLHPHLVVSCSVNLLLTQN